MHKFLRFTFTVALTALIQGCGNTKNALTQPAKEDLASWTERYSGRDMPHVLLLVKTVYEDPRQDPVDALDLFSRTWISQYKLMDDGTYEEMTTDWRGAWGTRGKDVSGERRELVAAWIKDMPPACNYLPPNGRRVLIEAPVADHVGKWVYDLANLPAGVISLFRAADVGIRPTVSGFVPVGDIDTGQSLTGCLTVDPDASTVLFSRNDGSLQRWNPATRHRLASVGHAGQMWNAVSFSPDRQRVFVSGHDQSLVLDAKSWKIVRDLSIPFDGQKMTCQCNPVFTRDGRFLLLHVVGGGLRAFDTQFWNSVALPDYVPANSIAYEEAVESSLAISASNNGEITLLNTEKHETIATLAYKRKLAGAAFSPDRSLLALITAVDESWDGQMWGDFRIATYNTTTGEMVHELTPFETERYEQASRPIWSPDGKYVMAAIDLWGTGQGIEIWNAKTGQHRAELTNAGQRVTGVARLPQLGQIVAGSQDGHIRVWDLDAALKQIDEFERSLNDIPKSSARN